MAQSQLLYMMDLPMGELIDPGCHHEKDLEACFGRCGSADEFIHASRLGGRSIIRPSRQCGSRAAELADEPSYLRFAAIFATRHNQHWEYQITEASFFGCDWRSCDKRKPGSNPAC